MKLDPIDFFNGLLTTITILFSFIVGIFIISKYFKFKRREFLIIGLIGLLLSEPWLPYAVIFISVLTCGEGISIELFYIIGYSLIPFTMILWFIVFTDMMYEDKRKILLSLSIIYGAIYEVMFFYFLLTDTSQLGRFMDVMDTDHGTFIVINQLILLSMILICGTLFAKESFKSDNLEIRLKGKLILMAFYSFVAGAILDIFSPLSIIILILARLVLISAAFEFYGGFILPEWMKHLLLKQD